jgi:hypothetical protein
MKTAKILAFALGLLALSACQMELRDVQPVWMREDPALVTRPEPEPEPEPAPERDPKSVRDEIFVLGITGVD